jgi:hypothetical protein
MSALSILVCSQRILNTHENPHNKEYSQHINRMLNSPPKKWAASPVQTPTKIHQKPYLIPTSNTTSRRTENPTHMHPMDPSRVSFEHRFSIISKEINTQREFNIKVDDRLTHLEHSTGNIDSKVDLVLTCLENIIPTNHHQKKRPNPESFLTSSQMYDDDNNVAMGNSSPCLP